MGWAQPEQRPRTDQGRRHRGTAGGRSGTRLVVVVVVIVLVLVCGGNISIVGVVVVVIVCSVV